MNLKYFIVQKISSFLITHRNLSLVIGFILLLIGIFALFE